MKKVQLISLGLSMLMCFVLKAQEKAVSQENSASIPAPIKATSQSFTKSKDTIPNNNNNNNRIVVCAPSRSHLNEPLYILDGNIIDAKHIAKINPNDIESIKVLKGNEAVALYGNQGKNGVIIITKKEED